MTEFGFIESLSTLFGGIGAGRGFEGIGDDCAIFDIGEGDGLVISTDMLVEGVHFLRCGTTAYALGRKSLAVNLSDIAAMGGVAVASLCSLSVPESLRGAWLDEFMRGYRSLSCEHDVALIGGDTTGSVSDGGFCVNVTVIGRGRMDRFKRRSGGSAGDTIYVTGALGGSSAGLQDILSGRYDSSLAALHRNPTARLAEGVWLGSQVGVTAMLDLSDGVASDLQHILDRSGVSAVVDTSLVPIFCGATLEQALCGGEDYELLFCGNSLFDAASCPFPVTAIGHLTSTAPDLRHGIVWHSNGTSLDHSFNGFHHF